MPKKAERNYQALKNEISFWLLVRYVRFRIWCVYVSVIWKELLRAKNSKKRGAGKV